MCISTIKDNKTVLPERRSDIKKTYTERAREHVAETRNVLQTFFDEPNRWQQKEILRNEITGESYADDK